jgi:hypothetical protein
MMDEDMKMYEKNSNNEGREQCYLFVAGDFNTLRT